MCQDRSIAALFGVRNEQLINSPVILGILGNSTYYPILPLNFKGKNVIFLEIPEITGNQAVSAKEPVMRKQSRLLSRD